MTAQTESITVTTGVPRNASRVDYKLVTVVENVNHEADFPRPLSALNTAHPLTAGPTNNVGLMHTERAVIMHPTPLTFGSSEDGAWVGCDPQSGLEDADLERHYSALALGNGISTCQATRRATWREILMSFIRTTADVAVPVESQENVAVDSLEEVGRGMRECTLAIRPLRQLHCY
ncbi:hypothetical protein ONZ43_g6931 [Nemania bipapillata]|uniref:Uncharacterized protein n=1 Tax=Nemania bipapillata TaxID=110536 RepID=A0ACC2HUQ7_9PEZI|nr:hypothetical protein ONZ43_g6931 [Nemania bipapillata]